MIGILILVFMVGALVIWMIGNQESQAIREKTPCKLHTWCWDEVKKQRWCMVCNHVVKLDQHE